MGISPTVWHMNEGHSAFLVLELAREQVLKGVPFAEAIGQIQHHSVFTTHTPVPAGNDAFPLPMIEKYFWQYWSQLGLSRDEFVNVAIQQQSWGPTFAMTVLALKASDRHNGVSKLHGHVARGMWQWLYEGKSQDEVPITSITNGVHTATWLAPEMRRLFEAYMGKDWEDNIDDLAMWQKIAEIPDDVLWQTRQSLKQQLVAFARERTRARHLRLGTPPAVWPVLDENAFTIGFARRFATYKRATLLLRDVDRLRRILCDKDRPVQVIFAGKAHPMDQPGKSFIREIVQLSRDPELWKRLVFVEDYDMKVAREMVQGVDLWLNTPRRGEEACGTSGMKAGIDDLLLDWARVARAQKRLPLLHEYEREGGAYSEVPFRKRFGVWSNVPGAMKRYAIENGLIREWQDVIELIDNRPPGGRPGERKERPLSASKVLAERPLYGPLIHPSPLICEPTNESGVIFLFGAVCERLGFQMLRIQTEFPDGEALRNDENFAYVAAWEFNPSSDKPILNREPLTFEHVHPSQRSYK
jgi:hypothetical protein